MESLESAKDWQVCLRATLVSFALCVLLLAGSVALIDPYDRGYFGLLSIAGVDDRTVTGNASRARDLRFDSAVLSNSTGQLIDPSKLSTGTRQHFVQLLVPGGRPKGLLATLDYFIRYHPQVSAMVIVVDEPWCSQEATGERDDPFPYWLYDDSVWSYASHLWNWNAIGRLVQRMEIGLGLRSAMRPDGHWSYEDVFPPDQRPAPNQASSVVETEAAIVDTSQFEYSHKLAAEIRKLPASTSVTLVVPPVFHTRLPEPQSRAAAARNACNAAFAAIVANRSGSRFLNFRTENETTRDPGNFVDSIHYRAKIAEGITAEVLESLLVETRQ